MQILKWVWLFTFFINAPIKAETTEKSCEEGLRSLHLKIHENRFITNRSASDYERQSSSFFSESLARLPKNGHWLDAGAGEAMAQAEFMGLRSPYVGEKFALRAEPGMRATAASYRIPNTGLVHWLLSLEFSKYGFRYVHGDYIERLPRDLLTGADLITDIYGPLAYTSDFTEVLNLYRDLLTEDGELIFLSENGYNKVIDKSETLALEDWLEKTYGPCGLEKRSRWDSFRYNEFEVTAFRWSKKGMLHCAFPRLRLVSMTVSGPPRRLFEVVAP